MWWTLHLTRVYFNNILQIQFKNVHNHLEGLSLTSLSNLIQCLWVKHGAYPRVQHLKGASLGWTLAYLQILVWVGKACQGQTLQLVVNIHQLVLYNFITLHWDKDKTNIVKVYFVQFMVLNSNKQCLRNATINRRV